MTKYTSAEKEDKVTTYSYSYSVDMVVVVLANNEEQARTLLETQGGYVAKREVTLLDTKSVYN